MQSPDAAGLSQSVLPGPGRSGYALAAAASIFARSIFRIIIIASNARGALALSVLVVSSISRRGVICQEWPPRSLHQPQSLSLPPLPVMASQ